MPQRRLRRCSVCSDITSFSIRRQSRPDSGGMAGCFLLNNPRFAGAGAGSSPQPACLSDSQSLINYSLYTIHLNIPEGPESEPQHPPKLIHRIHHRMGGIFLQHVTLMNTPLHTNRRHADAPGHIEIVASVADHNCLLRLKTVKSQNFLEHQGVRLGPGFVSAAGNIEVLAKPAGYQRPLQAPTAFAGSHRAAAPGAADIGNHICHTVKHILGRSHLLEKITGITFPDALHFIPGKARIEFFQRLDHTQANNVPIGFTLKLGIAKLRSRLVQAVGNMVYGINQGSVPVKNHNFYIHQNLPLLRRASASTGLPKGVSYGASSLIASSEPGRVNSRARACSISRSPPIARNAFRLASSIYLSSPAIG